MSDVRPSLMEVELMAELELAAGGSAPPVAQGVE